MPVYVVEQLVIPGPMSAELAARMQPMKTLAEVEAFLKSIGLPFMWQRSTLNTAQVDGRILTQIMQLPPGEVFVLPGQNNRVYISVIVGKR
jgi:hypothetical protein